MNLGSMIAVIKENPEFALMKGLGRFGVVRSAVKEARSLSQRTRWTAYCDQLRGQMHNSILAAFDPDEFAGVLNQDGVALGLMLPSAGSIEESTLQSEYSVTGNGKPFVDSGALLKSGAYDLFPKASI